MASLLTQTELLTPTNVDYGWIVDDFYEKNSLDQRLPNTVIATAPQYDTPTPAYYLNRKVAAILQPSGIPNGYMGLSPDQLFVLSGRGWYEDPIRSRHGGTLIPFSSWTTADAQACVDYWGFRGTGAKYTSGDWKEEYGGTAPYYNQNPAVYEYLHKAYAALLNSRNQIHYGDYDGSFLINNELESSAMYAALNSPSAALSFMMRDPFFALGFYAIPGFGNIINDYYRGVDDVHPRLFELGASHALMLLTKQATGYNFPVMQYTEGVINEFQGYTAGFKMSVPGGGYITTAGAGGGMDYGYMLTQYFDGSTDCQVVTGFFDPSLFGRDKNHIQPDQVNYGGAPIYTYHSNGSGYNPSTTLPRIDYGDSGGGQRGVGGGPIAATPLGFHASMGVGYNFAADLISHVGGSKNFIYPSIKRGSTTYTPGSGHSMMVTAFQNYLPYVRGYRDPTTGNGWVRWHYAGGKSPINVDLNVGGVVFPNVRMVPGCPQFKKFTSSL